MTDKEFFAEVKEIIDSILNAKTNNFLELAEQAELNPTEDLAGSDLREVDFGNANLEDFNFSEADLSNADFSRANLSQVNLHQANLSGANLRKADLKGADLSEANLKDVDLTQACLEGANLKNSQALGANFSKANLTGACLEEWKIDDTTQLDEVNCEYVFLQEGQQQRYPAEGRFVPGEFAKLFHPKSIAAFTSVVNLRKWLKHDYAEAIRVGWQMIGVLLDPKQEQLAFVRESTAQFRKDGVQRTKLIDLGRQAVVLLVAVASETEQKAFVLAQAHPTRDKPFVPSGLKLVLLANEKVLQEAKAREQDNYTQLKRFTGPIGQQFSICITFDDITVIENFEL